MDDNAAYRRLGTTLIVVACSTTVTTCTHSFTCPSTMFSSASLNINVVQSVSPIAPFCFVFFARFSTDPPWFYISKRLNCSCTCSSHLHLHSHLSSLPPHRVAFFARSCVRVCLWCMCWCRALWGFVCVRTSPSWFHPMCRWVSYVIPIL